MSVVERGPRKDRSPRSRWPDRRTYEPPPREPDPPPARFGFPAVTLLFAAISVAVFVYGVATQSEGRIINDYSYRPALLVFADADIFMRLVTHMFVHDGWVHLLVNMLVLYTFGRGLEPAMGSLRFLVLYLLAGIAAAIGQGILTDSEQTQLVGASGAISGVLGAAVMAAPRMMVLFFIFPMPLFVSVVILVALHIAAIAFRWEPEIAWHAHLVGLAAGAILYPVLRRRY